MDNGGSQSARRTLDDLSEIDWLEVSHFAGRVPTWLRSRERIANERRLRTRYGDLLEDVIFLRQRDFAVFLDGWDKHGRPVLLCDGKHLTADEVRAKAARERRLLGLATYD